MNVVPRCPSLKPVGRPLTCQRPAGHDGHHSHGEPEEGRSGTWTYMWRDQPWPSTVRSKPDAD